MLVPASDTLVPATNRVYTEYLPGTHFFLSNCGIVPELAATK
jgi:hypothetical protein